MDMLLPLFVAVPLACSAVAAIAPWRVVRDVLALLAPAGIAVGGAALFVYTQSGHTTVAHNVGLYTGGVSIPFVADAFSAVMLTTTGIVAVAANWFAIVVGETRARFYPALALMLSAGVCGALLTGDLFNLFVFIEVMLLPSYGLITMTGTFSRLAGGRTFVLVNLLTSTILLVGVAFVYANAGTANIAALAGAAAGHGPVTVAMGLVVIALAIKSGLFPVHTWLPRTYPGTSPAVMALFSGLHTKVAVYALMRIMVVIFDLDPRWNTVIIVVCVASMLVGAYAGLGEHTIRQVIGYQMVNGMPFILVVLAFTAGDARRALAAGIFYMIHHMITVGGLVLTAGAVEETYGTGKFTRLSGLARRDPLVATVFAAAAFSIVGLPPFSGVWGKLFIVMEVAREADWKAAFVIAVIAVASFGALLSMMRLWREVFWGKDMNPEKVPETLVVATSKLLPGATLTLFSVALFFLAGFLVSATMAAAGGMLDVDGYVHAVLGSHPLAAAAAAGH
ncbi:monovalent cation/H+ antiporter subunit D family protein [Corynebacterium aquilae]|uniref:Cation:proton antiporter n=1 Tax=Corynebacterium aquilae DSM 44791 TaxID=1431546 RepID=A0A1L7CDJ2_9CORY|nr:monovalent cation/H+ antiporter subunit D family protein [Corynebacterium aquilae]APT83863.1 cation:proton antiporter [Corynebacterium aquilae DSM 44791]